MVRPPITPRREKKTIQRKIQFLNNLQLPTSNRFSALSNRDEAMITDEPQQQNKKSSVSPLVVTEHETDIQAILKELNLNCNLKLNSVGRKIFPETIDDKNKIIQALKNKKIDFFSVERMCIHLYCNLIHCTTIVGHQKFLGNFESGMKVEVKCGYTYSPVFPQHVIIFFNRIAL